MFDKLLPNFYFSNTLTDTNLYKRTVKRGILSFNLQHNWYENGQIDKKKAPYFTLAAYHNNHRKADSSILYMCYLAYDLDEHEQSERFLRHNAVPYEYYCHTTASSTPNSLKTHLIFPLYPTQSHHILEEHYPNIEERTAETLNITYDLNAKGPRRLLFMPNVNQKDFQGTYNQGKNILLLHGRTAQVTEKSCLQNDPAIDPVTAPVLPTKLIPFNPNSQPLTDLPITEIKARLSILPTEITREEWLAVGSALHHQFEGSDQGLFTFNEYSEHRSNYKGYDDVERTYKSFTTSKTSPRTFASIIEQTSHDKLTPLLVASIKEVSTQRLTTILFCKDILPHLKLPADKLLKTKRYVRDMLKTKTGKVVAMHELTPAPTLAEVLNTETQTPAPTPTTTISEEAKDELTTLHENTVFDLTTAKFICMKYGSQLSTQQFNECYGKLVPKGKDQPTVADTIRTLMNPPIPHVYGSKYTPNAENNRFIHRPNGDLMLNKYSAKIHPLIPRDPLVEAMITDHLTNLAGGPKNLIILLDYISTLVQFPGKKMYWTIMMQSVEGAGKGLLGKLIQGVIGTNNVNYPKQSDIESNFSSWAECQLAIISEIQVSGKVRKQFTDALKSWITESRICMELKNKDAITIDNYMNFILYTNFKYALNIETTERRYCIMYALLQTKAQLLTAAPIIDRFKAVVDSPSMLAAAYAFFKNRTITPGFHNQTEAPDTDERTQLLSMNSNPEHEHIRDMLTTNANLGTNLPATLPATLPHLIIGTLVWNAFAADDTKEEHNGYRMDQSTFRKFLLQELKYSRIEKQSDICGKKAVCYIHADAPPELQHNKSLCKQLLREYYKLTTTQTLMKGSL